MNRGRKLVVPVPSLALVAVGLLLTCTGNAWAQGTVRGTVSDPLGAAVSGATVSLMQGTSTAGTTTTDDQGAFSFSSVSPGRYIVLVEASGFAPYHTEPMYAGSGGTLRVDVPLQVGSWKQEVVVSATGTEVPISQVGASVGLVGPQELQSQNKLDVLETIRQIPGAQIVQTSQRGGTTSLFVRGGESNFNKVLIDGIPVNAIGGGFDFSRLSTSGVEKVEVLSGPNSVLYGADGLAGVVSITTRRGSTRIPELTLKADGGNFGTRFLSAGLGGAWSRIDYYSEFSRFDTQGSLPNSSFHNGTAAGNIGFAVNPSTEIRLTGRRIAAALGLPNGRSLYGIPDDSSSRNDETYATASLTNQTTERWRNQARFAFAQFDSLFSNPGPTGTPFDPFGFGANYLGRNMTITGANGFSVTGQPILDFGGVYPQAFPSHAARRSAWGQTDYQIWDNLAATFGFRYEHENGQGITRDNYGYYLQANGNLGYRLYATVGVGLEDNAVFGFAAAPRVSLAYYVRTPTSSSALGDTKLKFNFGTGIKEPAIFQQASTLFALLTPTQRTQLGVGPVGAERSRAFDFGVEQSVWNNRGRVELTLFHNRFYDLISFLNPASLVSIGVPQATVTALQRGPDGIAGTLDDRFGAYVNATSTRSLGAELVLNFDLGYGVRARGSYTYLSPIVTEAFGSPAGFTSFPGIAIGAFSPLKGARPFRRAPHTGTMTISYTSRRFTGAFTGYLVSRRDDSTFLSDAFFGNSLLLPNRNLAQSYQKFDLSGSYALTRNLSLYTSIENLFSQRYEAVFGFPALPFTIRSGVKITIGGAE